MLDKIKSAFAEVNAEMVKKLEVQDIEMRELKATRETTAKKIAELETKYDQRLEDLLGALKLAQAENDRLVQSVAMSPKEVKSPGQIFVDSKEYSEFKGHSFRGSSRTTVVPSTFSPAANMQALKSLTGGDSLRDVLSIERVLEILRMPSRMDRVRDLFPVFNTVNSSVEYSREKLFTNNAATVTEGASKPETHIEFEDKSATLRTIAHWLPVNNQLLDDVAALRGFIDTRLIEGLKLREDIQILYGSGVDPDLNGILTDADIQTYLWSSGAVGDTRLDAIRRSITLARLAEIPVTGIVVNPQDWERIELLKTSDRAYVWVTVPEGGKPMVWRVPVIETTAITAGDALCGGFSMGAAIWDRQQAGIRVSESHSDYFIKNKTCILAEERIAVTVFRPQAFVYTQFDTEPTS